jgi:hypothetical protein
MRLGANNQPDATMTGSMRPGGEFLRKLTATNPATKEVVVEAIPASPTGNGETFNISTGNNRGGFHRPGHMIRNSASGGVIMFMDGHVGWRKFRSGVNTTGTPGRGYIEKMYYTPDGRALFWF